MKNVNAMTELAETLINKDVLEMTETELALYNAPSQLEAAEREIERLRALVVSLAKNELSEAQKQIILA